MRLIVQFVLPALILIFLIYVVAGRHKRTDSLDATPAISNSTFVLFLVIGSGFTVALLFGLAQL